MGKTKLIVAVILAVGLLVGGSVAAYAGGGATVTKDVGCYLPGWASGLTVDLWTTDVIEVDTPSGNTMLSCRFDIPAGFEPAKAIKNTGFICGTYGGVTTDTQSVASPGGKAVLNCQIKAAKAP